MAGIEAEVLGAFLAQLEHAEDVPQAVTDKLRTLLAAEKLPKPEQLASVYAEASGEPSL